MIDYFLHGVQPTVFEVGLGCFLIGIAIMFLGIKFNALAMGAAGLLFAIGAVIYATAWWLFGPFAVAWFVVLAVIISLNMFFNSDGKRRNISGKSTLGAFCLLALVSTVAFYVDKEMEPGAIPPLPPSEDFCSVDISKAKSGYLQTEKFIPLRAVARLPNVRLSLTEAVDELSEHAGIMRTWYPYYVFDRRNGAIQIADSSRAAKSDRRWITREESFCWTTRECINIEKPMSLFANREDVTNDTHPLERGYTYSFAQHSSNGRKQAQFEMPCLPVLRRENSVWGFVRPEGKVREGYQVAWIKWEDTNEADIRIRVTRREMDEYIIGLQTLLIKYRNPDQRETAKRQMYGAAGDFISSSKREDEGAFNLVTTRLEGIPKLDGFMAAPPENDLQVRKIKDDLLFLLRFQSTAENWNASDVAYPLLTELP